MPTISGVGNKSNISFSNKNIYKATNNFINQKIQQFTDAFSRKNDYETIDYNAQNVTENTTQTKDRSIVSTYLQTRATFTLSTVSGILSVGEDIADGGAIVLGGLTSKIVGKFDPEKGKAIENSVSKFVKEDYMDRLYDAAVTTIGIDEDIAYGKTHTAGNIVGNIAGYAAITLTTGGVATVAISGLAAAGNAAETALNSGATFNQTFAVSLVAGAIGALSGGALDKIGEKILIQKVVNPKTLVKYIASGSLVSMSEPVVNKVTEYLTYGKNLSDNFFDYFKETGGITNTLIAGAVGSLSVAGKAYKGYSEMKNNPKIFKGNENDALKQEYMNIKTFKEKEIFELNTEKNTLEDNIVKTKKMLGDTKNQERINFYNHEIDLCVEKLKSVNNDINIKNIELAKVSKKDYDIDIGDSIKRMDGINPKLAKFYSEGKISGKELKFFLGFEEHNFLHVKRVADESVDVVEKMYSLIDNGTIHGFGKIKKSILYSAGLSHDLGMKSGGYFFSDINVDGIEKMYSLKKHGFTYECIPQSTNGFKIEKKIKLSSGKIISSDLSKEELTGILDKYNLIKDVNGDFKYNKKIQTIVDNFGTAVRKNHPLNSAITVLQNRDIFGDDSEMVACLALIHSKSTSGVKNISSYSELSSMVKSLQEGQYCNGVKIYDFDASKLVKCDSNGVPVVKNITEVVNGKSKVIPVYDFKKGIIEDFRTGAVALRIGDAHAHKTGFNQGGGKILINSKPAADFSINKYNNLTEGVKVDKSDLKKIIEEVANAESKNSVVNIAYFSENDNKIDLTELSGEGYDFSKRIVLGEANAINDPVVIKDNKLEYNYRVLTTDAPVSTWIHGIQEKFGEYRTFKELIPQKVVVTLPKTAPDNLVELYEKLAKNYKKNDQTWNLDIKILREN